MSVSVPPQKLGQDLRNVEVADKAALRKIQLKNIRRETVEMKPQWKAAQQKLYSNMLDITPDITLGQVLKAEAASS